ncbi:cytosol aminopeptidase [Desulfurobacterium thermolithotrophum DSM 11699]|uniref:Probable cytosol aminopeptidase n=1 Tax=Desulfurobacterium thermolithotrophum (strain DSM 11699 / BSA) TaxID=868864 RepID=F0S3L9_DESTD|nr:leucyl aminopeptidase [Desulfurobacterium thermolithotrophum]ADY73441.1 cytosol aminopeptidase [Desulfurobacterium thermolithotrophum DSM 11699]
MKITYTHELPANKKGDALVIGVYEGLKNLTKEEVAQLKSLSFSGKLGEVVTVPGTENFKTLIYVGLGKKTELKTDVVRLAAAKGIKSAKRIKAKKVVFELFGVDKLKEKAAKALAEGIVLGNYSFNKYKSKEEEKFELEKVTVAGEKEYKKDFESGYVLAEAANFTRDIVNEPGNVVTPEKLAEIAKELSEKYGFKCKVFKEKELEKNKMFGILTVGKGSKNPPRFIHITYKPKNPKKKIAIVGKGVTFDSGGLNIKPEQFMKTMKSDKAGACAVLGIMKAVGELKPDVEIHALIPTVENMPGGKAYRPDDIIVYKNGKSVEIHSTDAEGRLILADALIYGSELEPDVMIDMATLTGACVVALGYYTSGLFTNDDKLANTFLKLSAETGEKMWRMPLDEDLKEDIKGAYSDLQNVGKTRYGGAITAALFLQNFVDFEKVKSWAHIDIAGPAFLDKEWKYYSPGATGQPVRTVVEYIVLEN